VYFIFRILQILKIKIDKRFALSISPFVVLGSSVRVLKDAKILTSCLFQTPGIFFLIFFVTFSILLFSLFLQKKWKIPYYKVTFILGLILLSPILGILRYENLSGLEYVIIYLSPWVIGFYFIPWLIENKIIVLVHLFDATTTFVSLNYFNYYEQHILPRYFIELTGTPLTFIIVKFIAVVLVLFSIDKFSDDKEFNNCIKLIIAILGASTGSRDILRLIYPT
jgi:uncharacterized membrane protein